MALYILGIAICAAVVLQMGMWISSSLSQRKFNRSQLDAAKKLVELQIKSASSSRLNDLPIGSWNGYREFFVDRLEKNVEMVTSVYLKPVDGKPIVGFNPGQHLSFRFQIPGHPKPVVRCYSLSIGPGKNYYRISVKSVPAPADQTDVAPGLVSNFINSQLMQGDRIEVRAPSGSFFLDDNSNAPVVLLAGGIGITPMLSMIDQLVAQSTDRLVVLFYGVKNGREHTFKEYFQQVAKKNSNIHVVTCYSEPDAADRLNIDYQVEGFVSIELIRQLLPDNRCQFYMCGPPPFMNSIRDGLVAWSVPANRIMFEAFGPASIKKSQAEQKSSLRIASEAIVKFSESGKQAAWSDQYDSILEMAESNGVPLDSGCRAGSCGTCATRLINGKVSYADGVEPECEPGEFLPCVAKPNGNLELDV